MTTELNRKKKHRRPMSTTAVMALGFLVIIMIGADGP